jgi:glycosyltransferase involved in cell wall biosynthesis
MKSVHDSLGDLTPHLTIAGNGPQFDKAHEFIASNQLQNVVTLAGRLDRAGLKNLFTQSDIFIQLSELEAFGIAAIEARAAGLAILGRADNGLSEFVTHGHTGYLESSDITVAARLIELVENPERVAEMKNQSRTSRPVQSWDFALAQTDDCYRTAQRLR